MGILYYRIAPMGRRIERVKGIVLFDVFPGKVTA